MEGNAKGKCTIGTISFEPRGYGQHHNSTKKNVFFLFLYLSYYKDNLLSRNIDVVNIGQKFILHGLFSYLVQFFLRS
jgi:hypothetical protein